jgi:hypothetical protein
MQAPFPDPASPAADIKKPASLALLVIPGGMTNE